MKTNNFLKYFLIIPVLSILLCKSNCEVILFKENPVRKELTENHYSILLPESYEIVTHDPGLDFIVYHINFEEISRGCIYFGNHPSGFANEHKNKITKLKSKLLGKKQNWNVYYADGKYFTEIIIQNRFNENWNEKIHLWAFGNSIAELENMLIYYSTLEKKNEIK